MATMTKRERIAEAWAEYRAASQAIPRTVSWREYLERDEALWRRYLAAERAIASEPETRAA